MTIIVKHATIVEIARSSTHGGWVVVSFPDHVAQKLRRPMTSHGTFNTRRDAVDYAERVIEGVAA
jgi:hypothetical protein